ncbi:hypothetical protein, partial [Microbulbifer discodermiae]|uniref:hypothetical protein n=1 Tax=Microbulbifer sp. 2201CG32-9 TaxID=3232309 RepID=UPI00345B8E7D
MVIRRAMDPYNKAPPDIDESEKALVRRWSARLERFVELHDKKTKANVERWRQVLSGRGKGEQEGKGIRLLFSVFASLIPQIYAKDPDIDCDAAEAAEGAMYQAWRKFSATLAVVLNRQLVQGGKLKKRAKSLLRATMTAAAGWVKVVYQRDYRRDPLIQNRLEDAQDNLQRVEQLLRELEDPACAGDLEATRAELQQQIQSLQSQVEVVASEGLVIDRPLTEDILILDDTRNEFDDYERADAIAHRLWFTPERFSEVFGRKADQSARRHTINGKERSRDSREEEQLIPVFEIWCKRDNTVYTLALGEERWARLPFSPPKQGRRWYPFFGLAFNQVDGSAEPLSDVELLEDLQAEYNETRDKYRELRRDLRPATAYRRAGGLDDEDLDNIQNRRTNDMIGVGGDPERPLAHDLQEIPAPRVDPGLFDTSTIHRDIEMLSGASDASRNITQVSKTATEAELMAASMQGRMGERRDALEDWISEVAGYAAEILLLEMTPEQVRQIAGQGAVWPTMEREDIYNLYRVSVRGGSTAKPNQTREREQWVQL